MLRAQLITYVLFQNDLTPFQLNCFEIAALKRGREEEGEMLNWKICVAAGTWDGEALVKSKHAETLHQVIFNEPGRGRPD